MKASLVHPDKTAVFQLHSSLELMDFIGRTKAQIEILW